MGGAVSDMAKSAAIVVGKPITSIAKTVSSPVSKIVNNPAVSAFNFLNPDPLSKAIISGVQTSTKVIDKADKLFSDIKEKDDEEYKNYKVKNPGSILGMKLPEKKLTVENKLIDMNSRPTVYGNALRTNNQNKISRYIEPIKRIGPPIDPIKPPIGMYDKKKYPDIKPM